MFLKFPTHLLNNPPSHLRPAPVSVCRTAVFLCLTLLFGGRAQAQTPLSILQKTQKTYQALNSYSGRASVTSQILYKGQVLKDDSFTVAFRCRRPNRLMLDMSTPSGSRDVYNNSEHFTVYDVSVNSFAHSPAAPDLRRALGQLITQAGVFAFLDPLYFIGQERLPPELGEPETEGGAGLGTGIRFLS